MTQGIPTPRSRLLFFAAGAALLLHALVAVWAAAHKSVTADEILYVTQGYYADRYNDLRIQPENGLLPQRLHGLGAAWTGATHPPLENNEYWRTSSNLANSYEFFYETGHDHFPMLMIARALNTLFSIGTGLLIFAWARHLGGDRAGLLAAVLYAADPNLLAHAALATSDMAAVFFLLASVSVFWWQLAAPAPRRIAASALVFGFACVAKYSAVLLPPLFAGLLAWHFLRSSSGRAGAWKLALGCTAAHLAGGVFVIWLCYGFRYSGFSSELPPATHYSAPWEQVLPYIGWQGKLVGWCRDLRLLPEAFLYGYAWVIQSARARAAFLAGEYGLFGWVSFFPLAFAWKTTLALLGGLAFATVGLARRWIARRGRPAADLTRVAPLVLFCTLYAIFSLTSHLNIGHRHLLPVYPALYIWVGTWAATLPLSRVWRVAVPSVLVAAQLAAAVVVAPHFIAFFNRFAGGPANGYRLLVDSSLDWGQDLPGLRAWLRTTEASRAGSPVYLAYFGSGEPNYYGINAVRLPFINGFKFARTWYELNPGVYCISATLLQQVYSGFGGDWTPALEREYRQLRVLEPTFRDFLTKPDARPALLALTSEKKWRDTWLRYDNLRFARLCAQLRTREPDAMIGYSILIYRVNAIELAEAIGPSPSAP